VDGFKDAGFTTAIAAVKNVYPRQILQRDLLKVSDMVYLQAG
jgi:hypothetical protein